MLNEDIEVAQKIVERNHFSNITNQIYHNQSFIYATTNEKIKEYQEYLKNRKKVLSVISSGDQILNTILENSLHIDGYDISCFPKYFMELKRAAILELSLEEYMDFFFHVDYHKNEEYDDLYDQIRLSLDETYKKFWDSLLNFFDWYDIYHSTLFSSQSVSAEIILQNNKYLKSENYQKLKNLLPKTTINYYLGDIANLSKTLKESYNFIHLSSIIYYVSNYRKILENLKLEENGVSLTYLYNINEKIKLGYPNCQIIPFENSKEGIMLYKKRT